MIFLFIFSVIILSFSSAVANPVNTTEREDKQSKTLSSIDFETDKYPMD